MNNFILIIFNVKLIYLYTIKYVDRYRSPGITLTKRDDLNMLQKWQAGHLKVKIVFVLYSLVSCPKISYIVTHIRLYK